MGKRGNAEGSIYQDGAGRWRAALTLGFERGRQRRKTFSGGTRREVAEKLARARAELAAGTLVTDERQTVGQWLAYWLEHHAQRSVRTSTLEAYESHVRVHLTPHLGRVPLARLTPQHVQAMVNAISDRGGVTATTVRRIHATLRRALTIAVRTGRVGRNVAALVDLPRGERYVVTPWSPAEIRTFLAATAGDRFEAAYALALGTGMREGEILGLAWTDIDLDAGRLTIRNALRRVRGGGLQLAPPKSDDARAVLHVPAFVVAALRAHRARQARMRLAAGDAWPDTGLVFTSQRGTPVDPSRLYREFQAIREAAGLPAHRFHDLRHDYATTLLALGADIKAVQAALRHSQIGVTANTYAHVRGAILADHAAAIDRVLGSGAGA